VIASVHHIVKNLAPAPAHTQDPCEAAGYSHHSFESCMHTLLGRGERFIKTIRSRSCFLYPEREGVSRGNGALETTQYNCWVNTSHAQNERISTHTHTRARILTFSVLLCARAHQSFCTSGTTAIPLYHTNIHADSREGTSHTHTHTLTCDEKIPFPTRCARSSTLSPHTHYMRACTCACCSLIRYIYASSCIRRKLPCDIC
jgi:hypothetical protein